MDISFSERRCRRKAHDKKENITTPAEGTPPQQEEAQTEKKTSS